MPRTGDDRRGDRPPIAFAPRIQTLQDRVDVTGVQPVRRDDVGTQHGDVGRRSPLDRRQHHRRGVTLTALSRGVVGPGALPTHRSVPGIETEDVTDASFHHRQDDPIRPHPLRGGERTRWVAAVPPQVALAETLVDLEFWAARAEAAATRPVSSGLLAEALPGLGQVPDDAEAFAWSGGGR